jgi:REP element-mobilizing transposase RayT
MTQPPVVLTGEQRAIVERTIREVIAYRGWTLHAINVRTNHIHVVVTAERNPETVMEQLKAWCSRRLSEHIGHKQKWWTEHGSTKWITDDEYLASAIHYVSEMQ